MRGIKYGLKMAEVLTKMKADSTLRLVAVDGYVSLGHRWHTSETVQRPSFYALQNHDLIEFEENVNRIQKTGGIWKLKEMNR